MIGHIRKRVQERRQQSFESKPASNMSPCSSPLTTPTSELPPKFPWPNQERSFDEDEKMEVCEIYKTPTQKAVPIDAYGAELNCDPLKMKEKVDGKESRGKRPSVKKLKLQLSRSENRLARQKSIQQRGGNSRYFLRSSSAEMTDAE